MAAYAKFWVEALESLGYRINVVSGYRSSAEQDQLYAKGRSLAEITGHVKKLGRDGAVTDAWGGQSAHNYGLAVDLEEQSGRQSDIHLLAQRVGWGTVSWDPPHIEWPSWRQVLPYLT